MLSHRRNLDDLQLDVLRLRQAAARLGHWDVLDPLVVSLGGPVVCGQRLGKLRHGLGQQVGGLEQRNKIFDQRIQERNQSEEKLFDFLSFSLKDPVN